MCFFVLSRLTGLARTVIIGAIFGASAELDTYLAAFHIPDLLFQLVAGGALGSAFIPTFAGYWAQEDETGAWLLFSRVLNLVTFVLVLLAAIAAWLAPLLVREIIAPGFSPDMQQQTATLMRVMLLGTVVLGAGGLVMGALNAVQHFLLLAGCCASGLQHRHHSGGVAVGPHLRRDGVGRGGRAGLGGPPADPTPRSAASWRALSAFALCA